MLKIHPRFEHVLALFKSVRRSGNKFTCLCPAHDDRRASLSGIIDGDRMLIRCHAGCPTEAVVAAVGLGLKDLFLDPKRLPSDQPVRPKDVTLKLHDAPKFERRKKPSGRTPAVASHVYREVNGDPAFMVERLEGKSFVMRRYEDGRYVPGLGNAPVVPYNLDRIAEAKRLGRPVFVVEGEKDADRLSALTWEDGTPVVATTNAGGAGKWKRQHTDAMRGVTVAYVIGDNDRVGRAHADGVAQELVAAGVPARIVELPVGAKEDVSDFLDAGGTPAALFDLCRKALEYVPAEEEAAGVAGPAGVAGGSLVVAAHAEPPTVAYLDDDPLPFRPFPFGALPDPIRAYVLDAARIVGCDPSMLVVPALTALSALVARRYRVRKNRTWIEAPVWWGVVVAEPGTGKTPALNAALGPIRALDAEFRKRHAEEVREYERAVREAKRSGKGSGDHVPPVGVRLLMSDVTAEAAERLVAKTGCTLLVRDELAGWFGGFDKFSGGSGDLQKYIELAGGTPISVDRKTAEEGPLFAAESYLSVTGTVQPGVLAGALKPVHFASGFVARMCLVMPDFRVPRPTDDDVNEAVADAYDRAFRDVLALVKAGPVEVLSLTPGAKRAFDAFGHDVADEIERVPSSNLREHMSKAKGKGLGLALMLQVVRAAVAGIVPQAVDDRAVTDAVEITKWVAYEHARVLRRFGKLDDAAARTVTVPAPVVTPEDRVLAALPDGFGTADFERVAREVAGLPERTARDWLRRLVEAGQVWKLRKGTYQKATAPGAVSAGTDEDEEPVAEDVVDDDPAPEYGPATLGLLRPFSTFANGEPVEARIDGLWVEALVVRHENDVVLGGDGVLVVRPVGSVGVFGVTNPADVRPARL